jgi:hypothetical protein
LEAALVLNDLRENVTFATIDTSEQHLEAASIFVSDSFISALPLWQIKTILVTLNNQVSRST